MSAPIEPTKIVDNVGDEKQVEKGKTKASIIERRQVDRWTELLSTEDGRLVVWEVLEECRMFLPMLGKNDAETNHNTGKHEVGRIICERIQQARPHALVEMMLENAKEKSL